MIAFVLDFGHVGGGPHTTSSLYHTSAKHQRCINMGSSEQHKQDPKGFHGHVPPAKVTVI